MPWTWCFSGVASKHGSRYSSVAPRMRKFHQGLNSLAMRAAAGSTGLPTLIHWASQALLLLRPRYQMNLHVPLAFFFFCGLALVGLWTGPRRFRMCGVQQTADRRTPLLARRDDGRGFPWPLILYPLRVSSVNPSRQYLAQGEQPIRLPSSGKSLNYPLSLAQLIWAL